jgi:hypothetical protein
MDCQACGAKTSPVRERRVRVELGKRAKKRVDEDISDFLAELPEPLRSQPRQVFRFLESIFKNRIALDPVLPRTAFCKMYLHFKTINADEHRTWVARLIANHHQLLLESPESESDLLPKYGLSSYQDLENQFENFRQSNHLDWKNPEVLFRLGELALYRHFLLIRDFGLKDERQTVTLLCRDGWPTELFKGELDAVLTRKGNREFYPDSNLLDERVEYLKMACLNDEAFALKIRGTMLMYAGWREERILTPGARAPRHWWRLARVWMAGNFNYANQPVPSTGSGKTFYSDIEEAKAERGRALVKDQRTGRYLPKDFK